jgi:hypothetical protein
LCYFWELTQKIVFVLGFVFTQISGIAKLISDSFCYEFTSLCFKRIIQKFAHATGNAMRGSAGEDKENKNENEIYVSAARLCKPPGGVSDASPGVGLSVRASDPTSEPTKVGEINGTLLSYLSLPDRPGTSVPPGCKDGQGIKVFTRIRPLPPEQASEAQMHQGTYSKDSSPIIYSHSQKPGRVMVSAEDGDRERLHYFDFDGIVFDDRFTNCDVFRVVGVPALKHFINGVDAAIFAFGPTGTSPEKSHV